MTWAKTDDGQEIYFEVHGTGPTLVFVSGYMGVAALWQKAIAHLKQSFRCIAYDNRGYGCSSKPEEQSAYTTEMHASDLGAVLKMADAGDCVLISHSIGGYTSTEFYLANTSTVKGIVYSGSPLDGVHAKQQGLSEADIISAVSSPSGATGFFAWMGLPDDIAINAAQWPFRSLKANAMAMVEYDSAGRCAQIAVPTLIIHGDRDVATPFDPFVTALRDALPNVTVEILPDTNHFPAAEHPERVSGLIANFANGCLS